MMQNARTDGGLRRSTIFCRILVPILLGLLPSALIPVVRAEEPGEPLTIGRTVTLHSDALGEDRTLLVTTPAGYDRTSQKYPVIYVLDGETNHLLVTAVTNFFWQNGRMPPVIVVSVTNTHRTRDFTPTHVADRADSGGGPKFLQFLKTELIPFVEKNYRTQDYRMLVGHSLCGMFAVWVMLEDPDLFRSFIAMSPYVQYDDNYVVRLAEERLPKFPEGKRFLYITLGDEPDYTAALDRLLALLKKKAPKDLAVHFNPMKTENHGTVRFKSVYQGMETLYADWRLPTDLAAMGLSGLQKHYASLSAEFGYPIPVPEAVVNQMGYQLLNQKKVGEAIEVFRANIRMFPDSANVYDSLGEALEQAGKIEEARDNYSLAVAKGEPIKDPNLGVFRQHLAAVEAKLNAK
jgi:predicted alpha/beta superfamily hydrolase